MGTGNVSDEMAQRYIAEQEGEPVHDEAICKRQPYKAIGFQAVVVYYVFACSRRVRLEI